jgi:hypothetical protein
MLAGELGVGRDRSRGREVEIALEGQSQGAADGGELVEAHVAEFGLAQVELAETEGEILAVRVQLREEPGGVAVRGEELDDGFEVDRALLLVKGSALRASVLEEFLAFAQVRASYGHEEAATIVENCGNTLVLRCSASEGGGTARFASQLIGKREVVRTQVSIWRRPNEWLSSQTTSEHHVTEHAVMPSEIEQLPDLAGFLKLASSPSWSWVNITRQ